MTVEGDDLPIPKDASFPTNEYSLCDKASQQVIKFTSNTNINRRYWLVGRQAAVVDLRIAHGSISRKHACFYCSSSNQLVLQHLGGKHGTHVNGQRVEGSLTVTPGDIISFGKVTERAFVVVKQKQQEEKLDTTNKNNNTDSTSSNDNSHTVSATAQEKVTLEQKHTGNSIDSSAAITRTDREAQIAAMVASLDETPSYQKYIPKNGNSNNEEAAEPKEEERISEQLLSAITQYEIPITQQYSIESPPIQTSSSSSTANEPQQQPPLTCLVVDPSGSRFATGQGSHVRLYDFSGMNRVRTTPFQTIWIEDGLVQHLCYSNTGDRVLVGTTSSQPSILDRDGQQVMEFVRGDPYVMDMSKTSGHVHEITGVGWHPFERNIVLTSSLDGSARQWNLLGKTQFHKLVCDSVYRIKSAKGQRTQITSVAYHPGGREFAVGTQCGTLQLWNAQRAVKPRPERMVVMEGDNPIRSITYHPNGTQIATRTSNGEVQIWDARRLSKSSSPLMTFSNVVSLYPTANCAYSPNGKLLLVACSSQKQKDVVEGSCKIYDTTKQSLIGELPKVKQNLGVVQVKWHSKLNQIFVAYSDGSIDVFYNETWSRKGALISAPKAGKTVDGLTELLASRAPSVITGEIIAPFATNNHKRKKNNDGDDGMDKKRKTIPEPPASGGSIKVGGTTSASATFTQFISASLTNKKIIAGRDPRQDLFQYHNQKDNDEHKKMLADKTMEEEQEEEDNDRKNPR